MEDMNLFDFSELLEDVAKGFLVADFFFEGGDMKGIGGSINGD